MKAIISRTYGKNETIGSFMIMDGERPVWVCKCIELPNNGNQQNTSCIPEGVYRVEKHNSPSKGECFHVLNVPNRSNILIHIGNYVSNTGARTDSLGCILPGMYFSDINNDGNIDVADSTKAMNRLLEILPSYFMLHIL